ncbi:MAG: porin [Pseudomonadota bacterium]
MHYITTQKRSAQLLVSLALAFPSSALFAQQSASSVTLYGRVDTSVIVQSGRGTAGPQTSIGSGAFQPSLFGFKGQEDLGDGVRAVFNLESTIASDTGAQGNASRLFDRASFVGLASNTLGTLTLGRQFTPLAELFYATDPLKAGNGMTNMNVRFSYLGGAGPRIAGNFGPNATLAGNNLDRQDNSLKYNYRNQAGLVASAMYAFGESANGHSASDAASALLGYDNGPLKLRGAGMRFHDAKGVPFNAYALGAAYQLNSTLTAKLTGAKNKIVSDLAAYGNQTTKVYSTGLSWTARPDLVVSAAYYYGERGIDHTDKQIARKFYLVPEYKLSVRTSLYAVLNFERFNAAGWQLDTGTPLQAGAPHSNYLAMGISHNF